MFDKFDMRKYEQRKAVAESVVKKDYSKYGFRNDYGMLKAEDSEVILILLTIAKLIECDVVKKQIKDAIVGDYLKDLVLLDLLVDSDETFYTKEIKSKTFRNIAMMPELDVEDAFIKIMQTINY